MNRTFFKSENSKGNYLINKNTKQTKIENKDFPPCFMDENTDIGRSNFFSKTIVQAVC